MVNYQHLIESGVAQWNQWRMQHPNQWPDLRGVDLSHSYLFEINLTGSNLSGADLRRACLIGSDLSRADLSGADLSGAYLSEASLREADLRNANLTDAQMANVDLLRANLAGTCLAPGQTTLHPPARSTDAVWSPQLRSAPQPLQSQPFGPQLPRSQSPGSQSPASQRPERQASNAQTPDAQTSIIHSVVPPQPDVFLETPTLHDSIEPTASRQATAAHAAWNPKLVERCQRKLSEYYIGPMTTLILNDIVNVHQPQTLSQFVDLVAAHIPDPQDALRFQSSFSQNFRQRSRSTLSRMSTLSTTSRRTTHGSKSSPSQPTEACIAKCRQQLTEYYIAPMAQMLVDDIISTHHPQNNRQLVRLIAEQLPYDQVEIFSRQVLS